jgi:hypothetical protein
MTLTINTTTELKTTIKDMTKQGRDRAAAAVAADEAQGNLTKALKKVWHTNHFGELYKGVGQVFTALCKELDNADVTFECNETALKHDYKKMALVMPIAPDGTDTEVVLVLEKRDDAEKNATKTLKVNGKKGPMITGKWRFATVEEETAFLAGIKETVLEDLIA